MYHEARGGTSSYPGPGHTRGPAAGRLALALALAAGLSACGDSGGNGPIEPPVEDGARPLTEIVDGSYLGFEGGLYPEGNQPPASHRDAGLAAARAIAPLDARGRPAGSGAYALLSIGMSNTTQEFCAADAAETACEPWSFVGQAAGSPGLARATLRLVNGARGGQTAAAWTSPSSPEYGRILADKLGPRGLSELQVQAAWVKVANPGPGRSLPHPEADAYRLVEQIGDIVRALRARYPNLRLVFLSSRIYAGYATSPLNPEPYAYESGLAVKWVIEAQIEQRLTGTVDPLAGNLGAAVAPWIGWGPYLWADGANPREDGLVWLPEDFQGDGTHPSTSGEEKVGGLLLDFFRTSGFTRCWFLESGSCS